MRVPRLAVLIPFLLCACSSTPPAPVSPLDYAQLDKINLDVRDLTFTDRGIDMPPSSPVINDQFSPTIADSLHNWASQRLQAVGIAGSANIVVKNAYVTEQGMKSDSDWFERGQTARYTGHADVEIEARGAEGYALATANATRSVTLPNNADQDEKRDAYRALLNGLMQDLNNYIDQAIHSHMSEFIVTAPIIGSKIPPVGTPPATQMQAPESPGVSP